MISFKPLNGMGWALFKAQNREYGIRTMVYGMRNTEFEMRNMDCGMRNMEYGTSNTEYRIWNTMSVNFSKLKPGKGADSTEDLAKFS